MRQARQFLRFDQSQNGQNYLIVKDELILEQKYYKQVNLICVKLAKQGDRFDNHGFRLRFRAVDRHEKNLRMSDKGSVRIYAQDSLILTLSKIDAVQYQLRKLNH